MKQISVLLFCLIFITCKKKNDDATTTDNSGNAAMMPVISYKVNGVTFWADSFKTVLKNCPSCGNRKLYFKGYHSGVNNFNLEVLPSLGNHFASTADVAIQCIPSQSTKWINGKKDGVVKIINLDTLQNIIQGQFSFTDSVYTISEGSFYSVKIVRE